MLLNLFKHLSIDNQPQVKLDDFVPGNQNGDKTKGNFMIGQQNLKDTYSEKIVNSGTVLSLI